MTRGPDLYYNRAALPHEANRFQCGLLRDLFGNPFSPACIQTAWLSWHAGAVAAHARAIYERGRFSELPLLADVLEAAGCTSASVLGGEAGLVARSCSDEEAQA
jgi:hypothetical protein